MTNNTRRSWRPVSLWGYFTGGFGAIMTRHQENKRKAAQEWSEMMAALSD